GTAGAEVVAGVTAADALDGVLPQIALGGGLGDGIAADVLQFELIEPDWRLDVEGDGAGVLADGGAEAFGQADVLRHQVEGQIGLGALLLHRPVQFDDIGHVRRQVGGGTADQLKHLCVELAAVHNQLRGNENVPVIVDRCPECNKIVSGGDLGYFGD